VFESTKAVIHTRMEPQGIEVVTGDFKTFEFTDKVFAAIVQYPNGDGEIEDYRAFVEAAHAKDVRVAVAADLMSLVLLTPPGEWGADIVFGSTQRFGVPMSYGGPSAAYMSCREEFKRNIPGRIVGISKDANGKTALRLALQTREQHIKREKATSNICTAQALLATMAGFYALYHGNEGLQNIAMEIHVKACFLANELQKLGYKQLNETFFDTLKIELASGVDREKLRKELEDNWINIRYFEEKNIVGISVDETSSMEGLAVMIGVFAKLAGKELPEVSEIKGISIPESLLRKQSPLQHEIFEKYLCGQKTLTDIAEEQSITYESAQQKVHKIRRRLKEQVIKFMDGKLEDIT